MASFSFCSVKTSTFFNFFQFYGSGCASTGVFKGGSDFNRFLIRATVAELRPVLVSAPSKLRLFSIFFSSMGRDVRRQGFLRGGQISTVF